jgi:hypothetical protein
VAGATVKFRGKTARTNAHGKVKFKVSTKVRDGRYKVVATKTGYVGASKRVRVT